MTDIDKTVTANPGISTMASSKKMSPSDCDNNGQPEIARLTPKTAILPFLVEDRYRTRLGALFSVRRGRKPQTRTTKMLRWLQKVRRKTNVKSVGLSGYERRNRKVFKRCLKTGSDGAEVMSSDSSFQMLAPATGNDRLPNVVYGDRTVQSSGWWKPIWACVDWVRQRRGWSTTAGSLEYFRWVNGNAVIAIAIRLRYDYDPTAMHRARLLPIRRKQNEHVNFFVVVVS